MLQGFSTQNGTGISINGDYCDLRSLYLTISKISEKTSQIDNDPKSIALAHFSHEVRKAYSEQRLKEEIDFDGDRKMEYLGFQYLWTDLLICLCVLRYQAAYIVLDELDQANLYLLEHVSKKALYEYDPEGATVLKNLVGQRLDIHDPLLTQVNEYINITYLKSKPTKERFRNLYSLMTSHLSSWTTEGKELRNTLKMKAEKLNLKPDEISFKDSEFPEVTW
ncbi:MAG: hypothetical protein JWP69_564 [Flaviaesturariibacter sp.]|nr:hypothetical protein [Flaviaesturariibacter sp.]